MSYSSHATLAGDADFLRRVAAAAAVEAPKDHQPPQWADDHIWWMAGTPGFAEAYESAVLNEVERPGNDPSVISDGMILSGIQSLLAELSPSGAD